MTLERELVNDAHIHRFVVSSDATGWSVKEEEDATVITAAPISMTGTALNEPFNCSSTRPWCLKKTAGSNVNNNPNGTSWEFLRRMMPRRSVRICLPHVGRGEAMSHGATIHC